MKDHIAIATHNETGLYHGLLYINHPTPSGCPRPMLSKSTPIGRDTSQQALDDMLEALDDEYIKTLDIPTLKKGD